MSKSDKRFQMQQFNSKQIFKVALWLALKTFPHWQLLIEASFTSEKDKITFGSSG